MKNKIQSAKDEVRKRVDEVSDPKEMSKAEYKEFLEELISDLEGSLDCVKQELEDEQEG